MTTEVLTGYTESDAGNRLTETASTVTITGMPANEVDLLYKDFGASYFTGSAYFEGTLQITGTTGATAGAKYLLAAFSDTASTYPSVVNDAGFYTNTDAAGTTITVNARKTETSVVTAQSATTTLVQSTNYYYRCGFFSALGQYGAVVIQIFSDSGRSTLVTSAILQRGAATAYRYFIPAASINNGVADTVSGTNADITLFAPAAGIDLSLFTEVDPSSVLLEYADVIAFTNINRNMTAYVYKDYGASHFNGDFTFQATLNITSFGSATGIVDLLSLVNTLGHANLTNDLLSVELTKATSTTYTLKAREYSGANYTSTASSTLTVGIPYWIKIARSSTTFSLSIYSDPAYSIQVGTTVSLTLHGTIAFQYLNAIQSYNSTTASTGITGTIGGILIANPATVNTSAGAFSWAGKTSPLNAQSIASGVGAFSWAGKTSSISTMIQATKGAFSWAGLPVNLNTGGQVNTSPGAFSWAGKSSPLSHSIATIKGAFSWAGKTSILGATVTSLRTWPITKWDSTTSKEIPVTGLTTVKYMLYDPTTGHIMDFSDFTFKASTSCVTPQGTMSERFTYDSLGRNLTAGVYDILVSTTGLSGLYQEFSESYGTDNYFDSNPVRFQDGVEYLGGLTVTENTTLNALPTAAQIATAVVAEVVP